MTPANSAGAPGNSSAQTGGFEFVRDLARALANGAIELPSYPRVALRLQKMLADEHTDADQLVRVLGAEAVLAARVTAMAGSAALNPAGRSVTDLRTAIVLMGQDALRTTTAAYAMAQLRQATEYRAIAPAVAALWQESAQRAAMCFVLARHAGGFRPDTAMLAGMLAGIGKLYLLARASQYPELFADQSRYQEIVRDWHVRIAQALLESWQIAEEIVAAVRGWGSAVDDMREHVSLADVLSCADLLDGYRDQPEMLQELIGEHRSAVRLGLKAGCARLLEDSAAELEALQAALNA
jgi:HD-like signal output (HDOD) protein